MQEVAIIGVGRTPVGEHWDVTLRDLALDAVQGAMSDANVGPNDVDALVIGNALSGSLGNQNHLAPQIASFVGLRGIEAFCIEGADASGGLALRQGLALLASGIAKTVVVLGVEKVTDTVGGARNEALATITDSEYEAIQGATPTALAGLLMRRYMHTYDVELSVFEGFSINAHANGSKNKDAMFRNLIKPGRFASAPVVAEPVNLFDSAPEADGAAAVVLTTMDNATNHSSRAVKIIGSAAATDTLALHEREDLLFLSAVNLAAGRAFELSGKNPTDIGVLELHDSYTVLSTMQLEAAGFAKQGEGWKLALDGELNSDGSLPISTFGGLKSRGNPLGATGIYQAIEVVLQLRGEAGDNQVSGSPQAGMTLNLGGLGSTAVAHIFERS